MGGDGRAVAVGAERGLQVVDEEEEDVGARRGLRGRGGGGVRARGGDGEGEEGEREGKRGEGERARAHEEGKFDHGLRGGNG